MEERIRSFHGTREIQFGWNIIYMCVIKNSEELRRHIAFQDYLREHTEVANEYGNLKEELARESKKRSSYIEGKTVFITNILEKNKLR